MAATTIRMTRDLFLWCVSVIYLFAFSSLFVQIPGLYGDNGILPAKLVLEKDAESFHDLVVRQPTLLRLLPRVGFDVQTGLDFLCLGGVLLSFVAVISRDQRNSVVFAALWVFYLSVFQVGQAFLWFKWDVLLLEIGFLTILVAPLNFFGFHDTALHHAYDRIPFWLVRWLLFRVTFSSGVAKLTGDNRASWWSLSAVSQHYETQYMPTTLAWYFYQFPEWVQRLSAVFLLTSQLAVSLFILSPVRHQRLLAFYCQVLTTLLMTVTGNYGFLSLLTLTLSLSLIDDQWLNSWTGKSTTDCRSNDHAIDVGKWTEPVKTGFSFISYGALVIGVARYFNLEVKSSRIDSSINFDECNFALFVKLTVLLTAFVGVISLAWIIVSTTLSSYRSKKLKTTQRTVEIVGCVTLALLTTFLFANSLVTHASLSKDVEDSIPLSMRDVQSWTSKQYHLTNSYLFNKRGTDDDAVGRSEVVIEGSNRLESGWKEYNFRFKPSNMSDRLPLISPHQPRLDFQMWFAARRNYQQNNWLLHLVYRLLTQQSEVLELLGDNPYPSRPPKYIRASLYKYLFTSNDKKNERYSTSSWWLREREGDYMPIVSLDDKSFVDYIQHTGLQSAVSNVLDADGDERPVSSTTTARTALTYIRSVLGQGSGSYVCLLLVVSGLLLTLLDPSLELFSAPITELADGAMCINNNGLK